MATKPTEQAPSFLQVYTQVRRDRMKHSFLRQINACVDWRGMRTLLNKKYTKTQNAVGNPAYDALLMFKILLLETWYGLSDYEVEERINDSLLFSEFLGLDLGYPSPDHSTISRFRSELTRLGIMDKLLRGDYCAMLGSYHHVLSNRFLLLEAVFFSGAILPFTPTLWLIAHKVGGFCAYLAA